MNGLAEMSLCALPQPEELPLGFRPRFRATAASLITYDFGGRSYTVRVVLIESPDHVYLVEELAMKSADGSALTYSGPFYHGIYSNARPSINLLKFLNRGKTAIAFDFAIIDGAGLNRPLTGSGWHLKDAQPSAVLYPGGLGALFSFSGKPYVRPGAGTRAHDFLNASGGAGKLRVTDPTGELGGAVDLPLTFDANNKFVFATDLVRKPSLKLNLATGQITGSITLNGRKRNMVGSLFMSLSTPRLQGYITGTTRNVGFEVIP